MNPRPPGPPLPGRCALTVTPKTTERLLEASLPAQSSLREDPQVLGEELAGPRAAGRPQRPGRPCPAASWGAEPSPSFPDPRKE